MNKKVFLVLLIMTGAWSALVLTGCEEDPNAPGTHAQTIVFEGLERNYNLFIPDIYDGKTPLPLLFDIHGLGMDPALMERMTKACEKANEEGFLVIQPEGYKKAWNVETCCGEPAELGLDDRGLIIAILDKVKDAYAVDERRVYLQGLSNGGFMSNLLACEFADRFAAVAPVAGGITYGSDEGGYDYGQCTPSRPIPLVMISGNGDGIVPFEGQDASFQRWLELNRCDPDVTKTEAFGVFTCTTYTACADDVEMTQCVGEEVGHCWPGTDFRLWGCSQDLDATDYIWDFVKRFQLP